MKRPFAVVGITFLITQAVAVLCGYTVTAVLFCVALLCVLAVFIFVKERPAWLMPVLLSAAVCLGCTAGGSLILFRPAQVLQGQELYVTGKVCEAPEYSYGRYYYIVETDSVSLTVAPQKVRFRLSSGKKLEADYGDKLSSVVAFNYSDETSAVMRNLLASGVTLTAYLPYDAEPMIEEGGFSLYGSVIAMRERFIRQAENWLGDELGGLLAGMFAGDTSGIDDLTLYKFRDIGLSHLFSVSGLHLSVLVAVLTVLLRRITSNYRATALMTIPFVVFFMAFSGFSMSIRRAGIMMLLSLAAMAIKREADTLNSLGIAALIICLSNPFAAGDVGMLLSFASTVGLVTLCWPVELGLRRLIKFSSQSRAAFILRPVLTTIAASIVSAVTTFPITVLCFGEVSLVSPVANALCVYPASAFMIIGVIGAALGCVPVLGPVVGVLLFVPSWIMGRLTLALTGLLARLPGAGISMNYPFMGLFLAAGAAILGMWFFMFRKEKEKSVSVLLACALVAQVFMFGVSVHNMARLSKQSICVFNSDGGVMTALVSGGRCVIIGAGGDSYSRWNAVDSLSSRNITDAVAMVLPDNSDRFSQNAEDMIECYRPDVVLLSDFGRRFEPIESVCGEVGARMYLVDDAELFAEGCGFAVDTFTDEKEKVWVWAECGGLSMLVCPENGDCALVPEEYDSPDVALIISDSIINAGKLSPTALIITADPKDGQRAEAVMSYRGMKNIFTIADGTCIEISESGEGILISEQ